MTLSPLRFLSEAKLAELRRDIQTNTHRYTAGDFSDLERDNGWAIESTTVRMDTSALGSLDGAERSAEADIRNSLLVYRALHGMTPSLAREERVWARLAHIECLNYARARWIAGEIGESLQKAVRRHIFAPGLSGVRDDNAVSRLWWNMHIATIADPADPEGALRLIVKRADIRMQFVERSFTASRGPLARGVLRVMRADPWLTATDEAFRSFMKVLNRDCGGILFEVLSEADVDSRLEACRLRAHAALDMTK